MSKSIFDSEKVKREMIGTEWKITTKNETKQGIVKGFENNIIYFDNGEHITITLDSKIDRVLKLTRKQALKRVLQINKILDKDIDKTGKLYEERESLMRDYIIGFVNGKFDLKEGVELERSIRYNEKVKWNNLLVYGAITLKFGKSKKFTPFNDFYEW